MPRPKRRTFLDEKMRKEEKELLDIINKRLEEAHFHLRLKIVKIHSDGSISTEYVQPMHAWLKEDIEATSIVLEELTKYQSR